MPRILFSLSAEIHKPLAIPGSPDIAGELTLEAPSDTIRTGTGPAWVSGWASTSVHPDRLDLPRTRVEFVGRKCVVPIATSKAEGAVTVHAWEWFEKADAAANLRALSGLLSGRDIEATGTLGAVKADRWEPPAQPDAPPAVKPPVLNWRDRLGRPMLWMGAPQYQWAILPLAEVNAVLDAISAAGLDGPSIEFGGTFIRDEYNKIPNRDDIADIYDRQADAWGPWETGIRARGQVAHVAYLNANQSKANRMSDQLWEAKARAFIRRYGPDNKLVLPLSESDTRCRASIGDAIARGLVAGGLPRSQIISMAGKWGDWREVHHMRGKVPSGNRLTINVNDNRDGISDLYGSKWQQGGTPNLPRIAEYVAEIRRKGVSGAIYSFGTAFDFPGCAAAGQAWGRMSATGGGTDSPDAPAVPPTATPGAASFDWSKVRFKGASVSKWAETVRLSDVTIADGITLHTNKADWEHWAAVLERVKVNANAWIIRPDGDGWLAETWEWMRPGQQTKERKNLLPLKLVPGQVYGWMISGLARDRRRNVSERSNVVWKAWV